MVVRGIVHAVSDIMKWESWRVDPCGWYVANGNRLAELDFQKAHKLLISTLTPLSKNIGLTAKLNRAKEAPFAKSRLLPKREGNWGPSAERSKCMGTKCSPCAGYV